MQSCSQKGFRDPTWHIYSEKTKARGPQKNDKGQGAQHLRDGNPLLEYLEALLIMGKLTMLGAGNGNPLQCSCLENPRDGGALWAAVYGVTQSRT